MPIYQQLHQTIVLFLLRILYINTFFIYIYMEKIIIQIFLLRLVSKYHGLSTCFAKLRTNLSREA